VFFTLSGYLMGKGFVTERYRSDLQGISKFYRNRALRIVPLYFLAIFIVSVLQKPESIKFLSDANQLDAFLSQLLFDYQGNGAIGALWSVSTEVQFYLAIPFIHIILSRHMTSMTRVLTIMSAIIFIFIFVKTYCLHHFGMDVWYRNVYVPMLSNLEIFLAGYASSIFVDLLKSRSLYLKNGMKLGIVIGAIYYLILSYASYVTMAQPAGLSRNNFMSIFPGITAIVTSIIIILFEVSVRSKPNHKSIFRFAWTIQSFIGLLTYSLYVWHEPILLSLRKVFPQ
jgi:peptidoglycan/LPS O-acetylase OafA/YrhL